MPDTWRSGIGAILAAIAEDDESWVSIGYIKPGSFRFVGDGIDSGISVSDPNVIRGGGCFMIGTYTAPDVARDVLGASGWYRPSHWVWSFDETANNPAHTYTTPGTYPLALTETKPKKEHRSKRRWYTYEERKAHRVY